MLTSPYEKYRQSSVQTSAPSQLLLMLYDGAIRFIRGGVEGIREQNIDKANSSLNKAQSIITELMVTLDLNYEVSKGLSSLYEYINHLLIESNIKKDTAFAEEALGYLVELREAWAQAAKIAGTGIGEATNG